MNNMSNKQRINILNAAKRNPEWCGNEVVQDRLIENECVKQNFTLSNFYAANGKKLIKLLGD